MLKNYTEEINAQILISLMKAHGIKKVVASPGTTNICFVASLQQDPFFEIYSSADERSAAYIACGLASESGEPVALSCTGATASRNYIPALTEAYYRKIPVLAVTSTQHEGNIGQNVAQVIDRRAMLNDIVKLSVQLPIVHSDEDKWRCRVQVNRALLELKRNGGGPVHINLTTSYNRNFGLCELPKIGVIQRVRYNDKFPVLPNGKIAVFVGAHQRLNDELSRVIDCFCSHYNAVVLCDQTSNYRGKYRVLANLVCTQANSIFPCCAPDLMIDIGNVSGAYMKLRPREVWRINPDGEIRDTFKKLTHIFEMDEKDFFEKAVINHERHHGDDTYFSEWTEEYKKICSKIPELPFSNIWIAKQCAMKIPSDAVLYLGILNTLRSWNFFETPESVTVYSNTGGFGIDGGVSTLVGMSLANRERLCFGIVGDLGFFYDMNALGNRHIGSNLRLMIINNGRGTEFRNYNHFAASFGDDADLYMAAAGHYGNQSQTLVKHYAEDLGYEYLSASNKEEYQTLAERFWTPEKTKQPMVFEVFTDFNLESDALEKMNHIETTASGVAKQIVKNVLGGKGVQAVKKLLK